MASKEMIERAREIVKTSTSLPPDAVSAGLMDGTDAMLCAIAALDAALPQGEDVGGVVELIKSRVDQEFDGEAHFSTAEALSFADLIAFLSAKVAEVEREREANRWNTQFEGEDLLICENNHEKGEPCEYERWVRVAKLTAAEARAERLEEALWEIASRNKSRDQLQEMARAALQQEGK